MRHNTDRIRVSHAGNLPRPADVNDLLAQGPAGGRRSRRACRARSRRSSIARSRWASTSPTTASTSKPAAIRATCRNGSPAGSRCRSTRPSRPSAPGWANAIDATSLASTTRGCGCRAPAARFGRASCTPGPPRTPTTTRVCTGPVAYTAQAQIASDTEDLQGRAARARTSRLRRRARPAEPRRQLAQRVLPERRGVHDRGGRGGARGVPGHRQRGLHRADRRAGVRHVVDVLSRLERRGIPQVPRVLHRDHQSRARRRARGPGPLPLLLGQRPPPAHQRHRTEAHRRPGHAANQRAGVFDRSRPTSATRTSGRSGGTSKCRTARSWCRASSATRPISSSIPTRSRSD